MHIWVQNLFLPRDGLGKSPPDWQSGADQSCDRTSRVPFPDIAPEIFSVTLFGVTLALRWYAVAYIAGLVLAVQGGI